MNEDKESGLGRKGQSVKPTADKGIVILREETEGEENVWSRVKRRKFESETEVRESHSEESKSVVVKRQSKDSVAHR